MPEKKSIPPIAKEIGEKIIEKFESNLNTILLYGSSMVDEKYWDLDIFVLLKEKNTQKKDIKDLKKIREIFKNQNLDLQLFYEEESIYPDLFSLDAHGPFFIQVLENATSLFGENPFTSQKVSDEKYIISLLNRIQRYIYQARHEFLDNGRYINDKNPNYHLKHVLRTMEDALLIKGVKVDVKDVINRFESEFPKVLDNNDRGILASRGDDLADYLPIYEKVYKEVIKYTHNLIPGKTYKPKQSSKNGLVFEYIIPDEIKNNVAVIVVDGLPRKPELSNFMSLIATWGYPVFFPRLKGTWESDGIFLDHDPSEDMVGLAKSIKEGSVNIKEIKENTSFDKVVLIGSSFGASVSMHAGIDDSVSHVIALSPFYKFSEVPDIGSLRDFLKSNFKGAYRFEDDGWTKLKEDKYLSIADLLNKDSFDVSKYSLILGKNDTSTPPDKIVEICENNNIAFKLIDAGHLALHKGIQETRPILKDLLQKI